MNILESTAMQPGRGKIQHTGGYEMQNSRHSNTGLVRILFVDDSKLIRFAGKRFLGSQFDVILAADGQDAWELLQQDRRIAAVVTDLNMPRMDGVDLIRRVRGSTHERLRDLPILVVTDIEQVAARRSALNAGASELVPKPFSASDLLTPLRNSLGTGRGTQEATGLMPNVERTARGLTNRLAQMIAYHTRHCVEFSLLHVRLDNHAAIAAAHGDNWSESVMRHLERTLSRTVRLEDCVGRSDRTTFTLILMNTPLSGARRLAERLRSRLASATVRFPGRSVTLAPGLSAQRVSPGSDQTASVLLQEGLLRMSMPDNVTRLHCRESA